MATPRVVHLDEVDSTQDEARQRFDGDPVVVIAARQRAGRGRSGARWANAPRALAVSIAWEPGWPMQVLPRLTLVAGLAACDVLGTAVGLKWPNDLMIGESKVGGILTESVNGVVVCGLGANLFWPDAPPGLGALAVVDPGTEAPQRAGEAWARRLLARAGPGPERWGQEEYRGRCVTLGSEIEWDPSGSGVAIDIAPDGGLIVATAAGELVLDSGAVRSVRPREL